MPINPLGWDLSEAKVETPDQRGTAGESLINPLGWDLTNASQTDEQHHGQHENCYPCKLKSLTFDRGNPKTHVHNGSSWDGSPVAERIKELTGVEVNTDIPPAKERP